MGDSFEWAIIGGAIYIVVLIFTWSLCDIAKLNDKRSEKYWEEHYKEDNEEDTVESQKAAVDT